MKRIKSTRILCGNRILSGYIYTDGGKIAEISARELPFTEEYDAGDCYVSPGFIDMHTHGGGGYPFDGTVDDVVNGCNFHLTHGTTSICPTVSAAPFAYMKRAALNIRAAMTDPRLKSHIIGAHMEGPYLSAAQCGAQDTAFITNPDPAEYEPFLSEYSDAVARWTYAPENDPDGRFCRCLAGHSVVPSAGHTNAIYAEMKTAMEAGCRLITHLYSCTSTITRDHGFRRPGVIETAYLEDDLYAEIIADGKHLPPELLRLVYKGKGSGRVALVTDSLALAGTDVTHGFMQTTEFIIEDGVCKLMDRSAFAGSVATADRLVRVMVKEAGVSVPEAVKMITETPAEIMGLPSKGRLAPGYDADLVVFDDDITVKAVFAAGERAV